MSVVVRRVGADEGQLLKDTRLAALQDSPSAFGSTYDAEVERADDEWAERARLGHAGADRVTFLAVDEERIVGLVGGYRPDAAGSGVELVSMWTSPEARRAGVGRALVLAVVEWARSLSAIAVDLWVTDGNQPALRLYEAVGFRQTSDYQPHPSDPCTDEIRMTLTL